MNIEITARHFTASNKLKKLVNEKIMKIEKFTSGIMNCHVILTKENSGEISLSNGGDLGGSVFEVKIP